MLLYYLRFKFVEHGGGIISLQAFSGKYLVAEEDGSVKAGPTAGMQRDAKHGMRAERLHACYETHYHYVH